MRLSSVLAVRSFAVALDFAPQHFVNLNGLFLPFVHYLVELAHGELAADGFAGRAAYYYLLRLGLLLKPSGLVTMEFPHLLRLMEQNQFDTIYHEHFSYFSFLAVEGVFARHGMKVFDVEELPTHGGSLRIYAAHTEHVSKQAEPRAND